MRSVAGGGWKTERLANSARVPGRCITKCCSHGSLTLGIGVALLAIFGWVLLPFIVIHHLYAWYGLSQANYVEHYGLHAPEAARRPL